MTAALVDRFVAQLTPAAVDVLVLLCHNAPQPIHEDLQAQAQIGISRARIGGCSPRLPRLPREVDYPIKREAQHRRYRPMLAIVGREAGNPFGNLVPVTGLAGI